MKQNCNKTLYFEGELSVFAVIFLKSPNKIHFFGRWNSVTFGEIRYLPKNWPLAIYFQWTLRRM